MSEDHVFISVGVSTRRTASFARIIAGSLIAGLLLLLFLVASSSDTAYATSFDPEGSACLDDFDTIDPFPAGAHANDCDGDSTPGVSSDITTSFVLPIGDSNFGGTIGFVPAGLSPASDADVPNGAIVSRLLSVATLGLLGGPCNTGVLVMFVMIDATTNTSDIIKPAPKGDQLAPIAEDADGNGIPDGADHYPIYLNLVLDPDFDNIGPDALPGTADDVNGPLQPPKPIARQFGVAKVSGITVLLNFLLFDPGTVLGDLVAVDPALGFPSVTVLQDPTVPLSQPTANTISDFCSPLTVSTTTFGLTRDNGCTPKPAASEFRCNSDDARYTGGCIIGIAALDGGCASVSGTTSPDESGTAYRTNPSSDSTLNFVASASSQRDADNDGIENFLDTCALTADPPDTDPRSLGNPQDPDQDGLFNSCDPKPNAPSPNIQTSRPVNPCESQGGKDEDGDCFANTSDNCPVVPNGVAFNETILGPNSQTDTDGDLIGDACEGAETGGACTNSADDDDDDAVNDGCPAVGGGVPTDGGEDDAANPDCQKNDATPQCGSSAACDSDADDDDDGQVNDGCPTVDALGAAFEETGHLHVVCGISQVDIGGGGSAPTEDDYLCPDTLDAACLDVDRNGSCDFLEGGDGGADSDGDGVPDADDRCPNTPAGATVDSVGCTATQAVQDDDNDGVLNAADECPNTPAAEVGDVDEKGCSPSQLAVAGEETGPTGGGAGGPDTGVGSLAPAIASIPTWAAIASGLGLTGLLGSLGTFVARILRRRR